MSIDAYGQTSGSNCDSSETVEAMLTVDAAAHDGSFENAGGLHYFQIDPATDIDVIIETTFTNDNLEYSLQLCDSNDNLIASDSNDNQNIWVPLISGTYYIVVGSSGADQYQLRVITDTRYSTSSSDCEDLTTSFPDDPLYGCQWHLKNTGQWRFNGQRITAGEDINIEGVWNDEIFGNGINVAVVDTGLDSEHEDLAANVNSDLNHDYTENDNYVFNLKSGHGTQVAGVIAAVGDNELGVRGVAPQASIYMYKWVGIGINVSDIANSMTRNHIITAVSNNSWYTTDYPVLKPAWRIWEMAVETGIREGFSGKGVFYGWIAGNGYNLYDQANFDELSNYYAVTTVCSVDGFGMSSSFSEEGVNLWICAPGSNITTTDNEDRYNSGVSGTSYSTPIVSGVAALMREVNSDLSWRDLKLILAASARKNDPMDPGWETVAVKYGSDSENYNYNPKYGFGVVDAGAAVELARNWSTVPSMRTLTVSSGNIDIAIPDHTSGTDGEIVSRLTIRDTDLFTEFVEINLNFTHNFFPDLNIQITSPDGTVSQLTKEYVTEAISYVSNGSLAIDAFSYTDKTHRFGSAKHLGEDPAGEWILNISDTSSGDTGTLHSWSIKIYGHRSDDIVPTFGNEIITDKEYMTGTAVTETLPVAAGGNAPLTYSLTPALPAGLSFNPDTRELSGTPTTVTNKTIYTYTVTDDEGDTDQITFGITVGSDVPTFGNEIITDKEYATGTAITETLPEAAGGNGILTYSLTPALPTGLSFTAATREISGTPTAATGKTTYTYTVTDNDGDTDELTFGITVETDSVPDFGSETITDKEYVNGTAVTETLPVATGGNGTLRYSLTPALPSGLNFTAATRELSGTPTTAVNKTTYTYTVTDADGDTDELTFGITVGSWRPTFDNKTITNKEYVTGTAITETLPEAAGGEPPLTYSITPALPAGLEFDPATRELSGTPTTAISKTTYIYMVGDADGDVDSINFSITIRTATDIPTFSVDTASDKVYLTGSPVTLTLPEATGGNPPIRYRVTPPLSIGLNFNANTRVISGTPTSPTAKRTYTLTVTDGDLDTDAGDSDSLMFSITVIRDSTPSFGSVTIDDQIYIAGTTTNLPVTLPLATRGNGTLTYSLTPALPAGLNFNAATRELSGTPTIVTSKTIYTYTVTDADGDTDQITFGITVGSDVPDFGSETIDDQVYIAGTQTRLPAELPEARGGNGALTYTLIPALPSGLSFDENTREISGTPASVLSGTYTYTVTDADGDTDQITFRITVETESIPNFGDTITDKKYITGTAVTETLPVATGGNGTLRYSITPALPSGLNFNANTREISGTPTSASSGTYTYIVTDADGDTDELTFGITVEVDTEPDFGSDMIDDQVYIAGTTTNLPVTLPEATGGNAPLRYNITPSLPNGLNFNENTREISGTPPGAGFLTYTYTVVDADGDTDQITFRITVVADGIPNFGGDTIDDKEYVTGKAVTETLPVATGGNGALTYSLIPALPNGLSFNENTRVISGTPASAASGTYMYTVTDEDGDSNSIRFSITVETDSEPDLGSETVPDQQYIAGTTTNLPVTLPAATGGNTPLRYSITSALPSGLNFNSNTRVISGTPASEASGTYTYTVIDADGDTDQITFRITVVPDIEPDFGSEMIDDQVYIAGTQTNLPVILPSTGGNGPLRYSITPALPSGLSFDAATRQISGIPASEASGTYTYTVIDADGDTDQITFRITVETDSIPNFGDTITDKEYVTGTAVTETLPVATGGNGGLLYGLTPSLPNGLRFNYNTRVMSGTLTTAMSKTTYTYMVEDADGDTAELTFGITVEVDGIPNFGDTITDKEYVTGTAVTETLPVATGGNGALRYSLTPALPSGLNFNANTREISGTPTSTASDTCTYTVTDEDGDADELTFRITVEVDSMPDFDSTTIPTQMVYTAGRPLTLPAATGGNPPVTYSITPRLPSGLSFNSNTRRISGTPTRASSGTYTYTVTDKNGDTAEVSFMLRVTDSPGRRTPPRPTSDIESGGGGGCAISDQKGVVSDLLGVMACLMLIPVSVVIRRKRRSQIKS